MDETELREFLQESVDDYERRHGPIEKVLFFGEPVDDFSRETLLLLVKFMQVSAEDERERRQLHDKLMADFYQRTW